MVAFQFHGAAASGKLMVDELVVEDRTFRPLVKADRDDLDRERPAAAPRAPVSLLRTSFAAELGKTVVVGSSRLNGGDRALIVLFTALP